MFVIKESSFVIFVGRFRKGFFVYGFFIFVVTIFPLVFSYRACHILNIFLGLELNFLCRPLEGKLPLSFDGRKRSHFFLIFVFILGLTVVGDSISMWNGRFLKLRNKLWNVYVLLFWYLFYAVVWTKQKGCSFLNFILRKYLCAVQFGYF